MELNLCKQRLYLEQMYHLLSFSLRQFPRKQLVIAHDSWLRLQEMSILLCRFFGGGSSQLKAPKGKMLEFPLVISVHGIKNRIKTITNADIFCQSNTTHATSSAPPTPDSKQKALDVNVPHGGHAHGAIMKHKNKRQQKYCAEEGRAKGTANQRWGEPTPLIGSTAKRQIKEAPLSPCNQQRNRQGRAGVSFLSPGAVWESNASPSGGPAKWQHTSKSSAVSLLASSRQCPRD